MLRPAAVGALVVTAIILSGCAVFNTGSEGPDDALMLGGNDPTSYFTQPKPIAGDRKISTTVGGVTYRFASEANRAEFQNNPTRYMPKYEGFCANGLVYAVKLGGRPDSYRVIRDRLYIFGDPNSIAYFEMDLDRNIKYADHYYETEAKGTPWRWQSLKRLMFQVPHYKTGQQLEAEREHRIRAAPRS
jgi:hypothetical protein